MATDGVDDDDDDDDDGGGDDALSETGATPPTNVCLGSTADALSEIGTHEQV